MSLAERPPHERGFSIDLLIRHAFPSPHWERWDSYQTEEDAEREWRSRIRGRGLTAMAWWGPHETALRMLADPNYDPAPC